MGKWEAPELRFSGDIYELSLETKHPQRKSEGKNPSKALTRDVFEHIQKWNGKWLDSICTEGSTIPK